MYAPCRGGRNPTLAFVHRVIGRARLTPHMLCAQFLAHRRSPQRKRMLAWPCRQAEAQNNIALCYESGEGVKRSLEEAVKWYVLAKKKAAAASRAGRFRHAGALRVSGGWSPSLFSHSKRAQVQAVGDAGQHGRAVQSRLVLPERQGRQARHGTRCQVVRPAWAWKSVLRLRSRSRLCTRIGAHVCVAHAPTRWRGKR